MGNAKSVLQQTVNFIFKIDQENLAFSSIEPPLFELDLMLIESSLPQLLAAMLIKAYKNGVYKFSELLDWLEVSNPLGFDQSLGHKFYEYKLKNFLTSIAENKQPYDYKSQANYLLENAKLIILNKRFTSINGDLLISMEMKIDID